MSTEAVVGFLRKLDQDAELREALMAALKGKVDQAPTAVAFGAQRGFEFTADEFRQVADSLSQVANGELTDAELESVAGGTGGFNSVRFEQGVMTGGDLGGRLGRTPFEL